MSIRIATWTAFVAFLLAAVIETPAALAHVSGASWTAAAGAYTADVGYDPVALAAGGPVAVDFSLWEGPAETGTRVMFETAVIRITRADGEVVLAASAPGQTLGPALVYAFPGPGAYTFEVRYKDAVQEDIAMASFAVDVPRGGEPADALAYGIAALAFAVGAGLGAIVMRARPRFV